MIKTPPANTIFTGAYNSQRALNTSQISLTLAQKKAKVSVHLTCFAVRHPPSLSFHVGFVRQTQMKRDTRDYACIFWVQSWPSFRFIETITEFRPYYRTFWGLTNGQHVNIIKWFACLGDPGLSAPNLPRRLMSWRYGLQRFFESSGKEKLPNLVSMCFMNSPNVWSQLQCFEPS